MKREEALEYMNRYLDHDLTKEETDTLFRHLGESPEAQEDFEFLKGLSDQLESLPDVQPPVSLVDSILPKLDEIDRLAAIAAPDVQPEKLSEMESKRMFGEEAPKRRKAAAFWRSTMGRAVGGTAVAAAVLGIFVVNYEPKEMPNAEVSSSAAVTGATDDTLVPSGEAQTESATIDPSTEVESVQPEAKLEPNENNLRQNEDQTEPEKTPSALEDGTEADEPASDSSNDTGEPATGSQPTDSGADNSAVPNSGTSSNDAKSGDTSQQPATPKSNAAPNTDGTARKNPGTSDSSQPSANPQEQKAPTVEPTPPASPPVQGDAEEGAADEEGQPNEGISTFSLGDELPTDRESATAPNNDSDAIDSQIYSLTVAPTEWVSPDSTYVITYSTNTLKLLKGDHSKELNSYKVDGEVTGGIWSADGKTFTYDLIKADGTTAQGTWKIEEVTLEQGKK
ncbi:hypothetical protein [Saccharibacillus sacchari]|uniref:Uncharacterized protein n=1 Tax=Saccharibacillus sacchari TaxID=456493 RepID=A0ACC6PB59_9BACL